MSDFRTHCVLRLPRIYSHMIYRFIVQLHMKLLGNQCQYYNSNSIILDLSCKFILISLMILGITYLCLKI